MKTLVLERPESTEGTKENNSTDVKRSSIEKDRSAEKEASTEQASSLVKKSYEGTNYSSVRKAKNTNQSSANKSSTTKAIAADRLESIKSSSNAKVKQEQDSLPERKVLLQSYIRQVPVAPADALCKDLLTLFDQNPSCECIVLENERGGVSGLAMRHRFSYKLAHRYSVALFYNKPALNLIDVHPIIVSLDINPRELIELAMSREGDSLYDCIVFTEGGKYTGIMTVGDLLKLTKALEQDAETSRVHTIQSASNRIREIANDVSKVKDASLAGETLSMHMVDLTLQGKEELSKVREAFLSIEQSSKLQEQSMKDLIQEAGAIGSVSHLIKELAEQCNLLSINASIEAARAGEFGRGFGVVAGEFAKLAIQTKNSAVQITAITNAIVNSIETAYRQMEKGRELTSSSNGFVEAANEVYHQIFKAAADNKNNVALIGEQASVTNNQTLQVVKEIELLR